MHAPDVTIAKLSEFEKHAADLKKDPVVQVPSPPRFHHRNLLVVIY